MTLICHVFTRFVKVKVKVNCIVYLNLDEKKENLEDDDAYEEDESSEDPYEEKEGKARSRYLINFPVDHSYLLQTITNLLRII